MEQSKDQNDQVIAVMRNARRKRWARDRFDLGCYGGQMVKSRSSNMLARESDMEVPRTGNSTLLGEKR